MAQKTSYTLIRSKRKTVALCITREAVLVVRAPMKMPEAEIVRFMVSKQHWIDKHRALREGQRREKAAFLLVYGSVLYVRNNEHKITAAADNRRGFADGCFYLPAGMTPASIKQTVIKAYRETAKELLTQRVAVWAKMTGCSPSAVKINGAKTRWGSCSAQNSINFSWRLIMAADDVIDYVVVHELAHIREHNHSERFWALVGQVLPDYKAQQARLKGLQRRLACEDWD